MIKVCVLMSTYNGEKHVQEQIDSILAQENVQIALVIRDDGSTDRTVEIIWDYKKKHGNISVLNNDKNLGPANSFMELLFNSPDADYYAFADQDDVWFPGKIERAIKLTEDRIATGSSSVFLYASNQILYYGDNRRDVRFKVTPNTTLTGIICGNQLSGCTMVFNRKLRDILVDLKNRPDDDVLRLRMHDTWVAAVAASCGEIVYDTESFILYRIHDSNTVGIDAGSIKKRFQKAIKKIKLSDQRNGRSRFAKELLKICDMDQKSRRIINEFASSKKHRIRILCDKDIKRNCPERRLLFIIKSILGWQ